MICGTHLEDLKKSGLNETTVLAAELYCADRDEVKKILGFDAGSGGLVIPYPRLDGHPPFSRIKPDIPPIIDSKPAKYLSPKGARNHLYIPQSLPIEALANYRARLIITEGEKKALKAVQEDIPCVALLGVWSWKDKEGVIKDLDRIFLKNRHVFLAFDSDAAVNSDVQEAERALARELRKRGATVEAIRIPPGPNGAKQGLDDFLATHSVETFWTLPVEPVSEVQEKTILTLDQFMARPLPAIPSLIGEGVITAASLNSLVGRAKLGKTWFTIQLALSISGIAKFFVCEKLPVHQCGRVLYVNAEVAEAMFQKRLGWILAEAKRKGLNTDAPLKNFFPITVRGDLRLDRKAGEKELVKMIEKVKPMLIVLDPIGPLHYWDENKQQDMGKLLNFLLSIVNYFNTAMIVVHHMGKSTENREEIHYGRGSSVFGDRVDSNLNLMPYGEQGTATRLKLSFTLRNGPPLDPLIVKRNEGEFLYSAVGQTDDTVEWLEDLLRNEKRIEREAAWERYKASGRTSEKAFRKALSILEAQDKLKRDPEGFPAKTILRWLDPSVRPTFRGGGHD